MFEPGTEPERLRTDVIIKLNRDKETLWKFSLGDHVERLCELAGLPMPIPYMRKTENGGFEPDSPSDWAHANTIEVLPPTPAPESRRSLPNGNLHLRHVYLFVKPILNLNCGCRLKEQFESFL